MFSIGSRVKFDYPKYDPKTEMSTILHLNGIVTEIDDLDWYRVMVDDNPYGLWVDSGELSSQFSEGNHVLFNWTIIDPYGNIRTVTDIHGMIVSTPQVGTRHKVQIDWQVNPGIQEVGLEYNDIVSVDECEMKVVELRPKFSTGDKVVVNATVATGYGNTMVALKNPIGIVLAVSEGHGLPLYSIKILNPQPNVDPTDVWFRGRSVYCMESQLGKYQKPKFEEGTRVFFDYSYVRCKPDKTGEKVDIVGLTGKIVSCSGTEYECLMDKSVSNLKILDAAKMTGNDHFMVEGSKIQKRMVPVRVFKPGELVSFSSYFWKGRDRITVDGLYGTVETVLDNDEYTVRLNPVDTQAESNRWAYGRLHAACCNECMTVHVEDMFLSVVKSEPLFKMDERVSFSIIARAYRDSLDLVLYQKILGIVIQSNSKGCLIHVSPAHLQRTENKPVIDQLSSTNLSVVWIPFSDIQKVKQNTIERGDRVSFTSSSGVYTKVRGIVIDIKTEFCDARDWYTIEVCKDQSAQNKPYLLQVDKRVYVPIERITSVNGVPFIQPATYKVGQRFEVAGVQYILSALGTSKSVILVDLEDGSTYQEYPVEVADPTKITEAEMSTIVEGLYYKPL